MRGTKLVWFEQIALLQCEGLYVSAALFPALHRHPVTGGLELRSKANITIYCIYKLPVITPTLDNKLNRVDQSKSTKGSVACGVQLHAGFRLQLKGIAPRRCECVTSWLRMTGIGMAVSRVSRN